MRLDIEKYLGDRNKAQLDSLWAAMEAALEKDDEDLVEQYSSAIMALLDRAGVLNSIISMCSRPGNAT